MRYLDENSPYHQAGIELGCRLSDYLTGISTLGTVHKGEEDFAACLWEFFAPDWQFPDREMTEEEDRIITAYLGRVTTKLKCLAGLAKELNERKRELRR